MNKFKIGVTASSDRAKQSHFSMKRLPNTKDFVRKDVENEINNFEKDSKENVT